MILIVQSTRLLHHERTRCKVGLYLISNMLHFEQCAKFNLSTLMCELEALAHTSATEFMMYHFNSTPSSVIRLQLTSGTIK